MYTTRALGSDTWDDFATLVEANNGVWGGCWCMGFHPEGLDRENASANRDAKRAHVEQGTVHQMLVYADVGLTRLHGPIRVKRSGSVKGVNDGQDRQALLA